MSDKPKLPDPDAVNAATFESWLQLNQSEIDALLTQLPHDHARLLLELDTGDSATKFSLLILLKSRQNALKILGVPDQSTVRESADSILENDANEEEDELSRRVMKLESFIDGDQFWNVAIDERVRILRQLEHMKDYQRVLKKRIERFETNE